MMPANPTDLAGKICVITGANGGIGQKIVEQFSMLGAKVYATDLVHEFQGSCPVTYQPFDLSTDTGVRACTDWVDQTTPDVFVNNAAVFDMGSVLDADLDQYDRLFSINVRAMYALMQGAARGMVDRKSGTIINMASQAGHRGEALVAHYCATKAAVISYTQSAALALAPCNVRVNAISPGVVDTPMWETVDALFAQFESKAIGQKKREVGQAVPLGRMGVPDDIAKVAVFLASDQPAYITAQTISVDGGNVLRF